MTESEEKTFQVGDYIKWHRKASSYRDGWNIYGKIVEEFDNKGMHYKVLGFSDGSVSGSISQETASLEFTKISTIEGKNAAELAIFKIRNDTKKSILDLQLKIEEMNFKSTIMVDNIKRAIE